MADNVGKKDFLICLISAYVLNEFSATDSRKLLIKHLCPFSSQWQFLSRQKLQELNAY